MFFKKTLLLFTCSVLVFCDSALVDTLKKCSSTDFECMKDDIQSSLRDFAKSGIPEYSIPPFDPYVVHNETFRILDFLDISFADGVAKGVRNCIVNRFQVSFEKGSAKLDITCDMKIKGKYTAFGSSDLIKNLLGGQTVHGNGNVKAVIEKVNLKSKYHFHVRGRDGDTYIDCDYTKAEVHATFGNMTFAANNLYLGETEASVFITNVMNNSWRYIMDIAGKPFIDRTTKLIAEQVSKFFKTVPTKYFISDDLSQYVSDEE